LKCWKKEAPADRVCASCPAGVDAVSAWCKSKRIEGAPWLCMGCYKREVRTPRSFPLLSRERESAVFSAAVRLWLTARRSRFPFFAAHRNHHRGGDDVQQVRVEQGQRLGQLPGRARGQGLHEVLPPGQPHEQKAEEVNVRVLYFLSPRFPRSRRSFDDAPFSPDAALPMRNAFDAIVTIDTIAGSE
jgi:hypothetical protein